MGSEWSIRMLGELTENLDSRRKPVKEPDRISGPYPYYGASGVVDWVDGYLFDGEYLLIAEDGENLKSRQLPIAFMAQGKFWVNNHAHIVQGNSLAKTKFLCYALAATEITAFLTGAVMPKLTQSNLNRIPILTMPYRMLCNGT
jgi:type I restriction enzyme S subunit